MTKQTLEKIIEAIDQLKGSTGPYHVAVLMLSGDRLAGVLHTPVGQHGFIRLDVTRIAGAQLDHGPIVSWLNLDAIQAVAIDQ